MIYFFTALTSIFFLVSPCEARWIYKQSKRSHVSDDVRQACLDNLNAIRTLKASFTQTTDKKSSAVSRGQVWLKRPKPSESGFGSLKLAYTNPPTLDIVGKNRDLYLHHKDTRTVERLPLTSTPLAVILRAKLALGNFIKEKSLRKQDGKIFWTLTEPDSQHGGYVTLVFDEKTLALLGWHIKDMYGSVIKIALENTTLNVPLSDSLFQKPRAT